MKKYLIFSLGFAALIILLGIFAGCNKSGDDLIILKTPEAAVEIDTTQKLAVTFDEETNMYQFAYKKSVLNMSKAKFDEYNLTNENIRKFFNEMEKVYALYADFFMVYNLPDVFTYNSVTQKYMESVGVFVGAFSVGEENASYYIEGWLEGYLKDIDKGLPSIVVHEVGHLFTFWSNGGKLIYNGSKYVWDFEVFAVIATEYLLSQPDFNLINAVGGEYLPITEKQKTFMKEDWYDEWVKNYQCFIHFKMATINEKYGYDTLHEVLAEMIERNHKAYDNITETFDLFFDIYSEKTGTDLKKEYFTQEELYVVYKNIEPN